LDKNVRGIHLETVECVGHMFGRGEGWWVKG